MIISDPNKQLFAELLHRVGAYVSVADKRGLWAVKIEKKALLKSLKKCANKKKYTSTVQSIIQLALELDHTDELISNSKTVPKECEDAIKNSEEFLNSEEIIQLKDIMMLIAHDVADANWEADKGEITPYDSFWGLIIPFGRILFTNGKFRQIFLDFLRNNNPIFRKLNKSYARISYAEDKAIAQIAMALNKGNKKEDHETIQTKGI